MNYMSGAGPLVGEYSVADFLRLQADNGILHIRAEQLADPLRLSLAEIEQVIDYNRILINNLSMSRDEHPIPRDRYSDGTFIDPSLVASEMERGGSVIIRGAHHFFPQVRDVVSRFSTAWGCEAQGNVYVSTPGVSATYPHFDPHELFIFQLAGSKRWRLFEGKYRFPETDDGFDADRHPIGEELPSVLLNEGDVLFLTRGRVHQPVAVDHSVHLALGLKALSVSQVLLQLVSGLARTEEPLRALAANPPDEEELRKKLRAALNLIELYLDSDEILSSLLGNAMEPKSRPNPATGWLKDALIKGPK